MNRARTAAVISCLLCALAGARAQEAKGSGVTTTDVLGITRRRCVECHGPTKSSAKLRLDSIDGLFRGGTSGPAVVAGRSAESLLYKKIVPEAKKRMPPPDEAEPLAAEEIETIRRWIDSGAKAEGTAGGGVPEALDLKPGSLPPGYDPIFALAGDLAGRRLAVARGALVEVWELPAADTGDKAAAGAAAPRKSVELGGAADVVAAVAFSPDGKRLAAGGFRSVRVWETEGWKLLATLEPHAHRVLALAFSPDGKRLAAGGGVPTQSGEIKVWDLEGVKEVWSSEAHSDTVFGLDWSADGKTILTGGADRVTYLLAAEDGKQIRRLEAHTHHVLAVALSPDGKKAATAGGDRVIRLWDLAEGNQLRNCQGHRQGVTAVAFARDGKLVASASGDGSVRFWNAENSQERRSLTEAKGYLQAGAYLAGGGLYAAAEQEGTVRVYDAEKGKLLFSLAPEPKP